MTARTALHRQLENAQAAHRAALAENEMLRGLLEVAGPMRRLMKAYAALHAAAWPSPSSSISSTGSKRSEFDRDPPHSATERWRDAIRHVDRVVDEVADAAEEFFEAPRSAFGRLRDECGLCGRRSRMPGRSRVLAARSFLDELLADGPVEATAGYRLGAERGHAQKTLDRASTEGTRVLKYRRHGRWWWELGGASDGR